MNYASPYDEEEHRRYHELVMSIKDQYGFYYPHKGREQIKRHRSETASQPEKEKAGARLLKAYFCRYLSEDGFRSKRMSFSEFAAGELRNKDMYIERMTPPVYEGLVDKSGCEAVAHDAQFQPPRDIPQTVAPTYKDSANFRTKLKKGY